MPFSTKQKTLFQAWKKDKPATNGDLKKTVTDSPKTSSFIDLSADDMDDDDLLSATVALESDISLSQSSTNIEHLPGFDNFSGNIWIYPTNYPVRDYQYAIVKTALFKNTLVALPTGLGKTFIAAVVMYNFYRWYPQGKIVFMAPTKPLVAQQIEACYNIMGIPMEDQAQITGATMASNKREELWSSKRVFFLTPQVINNDLARGVCPSHEIKCLVIDEAHKALGNHAYCTVVQQLLAYTKDFRVLALSATPGSDLNSVQQVLKNLLISHIEVRGEDAIDIKKYTHSRKVDKVVVKLDGQIKHMKEKYFTVIQVFINNLVSNNAVYNKDVAYFSKYALLMSRDQFRKDPPTGLSKYTMGQVEGDFAISISLYHGLELLLQHGMKSFFIYLKAIAEGSKGNMRSKTILQSNAAFRSLYNQLTALYGDSPNSVVQLTQSSSAKKSEDEKGNTSQAANYVYGHPKMRKLEEVVLQHFRKFKQTGSTEETRVMIFCQYRDSVREITELLQTHRPLIRPMQFVGHAPSSNPENDTPKSGKTNKRFTQKDQLMVVNKFRSGGYNTLVSTCVGEEGLDIGDVDLIVCFDSHKSPIRLVQRMGRTGRKREGRIVMLVTEGKEERDYNSSVASKKSIHKAITGAGRNLQFYPHNRRMVPQGINPTCHKMFITVAPAAKQEDKKSKTKSKKSVSADVSIMLKKAEQKSMNSSLLDPGEKTTLEKFRLTSHEKVSMKKLPQFGQMLSLNKQLIQENPRHNELSLNEWMPWQSRLQPTNRIGHSSTTKLLTELLESCEHLKQMNEVEIDQLMHHMSTKSSQSTTLNPSVTSKKTSKAKTKTSKMQNISSLSKVPSCSTTKTTAVSKILVVSDDDDFCIELPAKSRSKPPEDNISTTDHQSLSEKSNISNKPISPEERFLEEIEQDSIKEGVTTLEKEFEFITPIPKRKLHIPLGETSFADNLSAIFTTPFPPSAKPETRKQSVSKEEIKIPTPPAMDSFQFDFLDLDETNEDLGAKTRSCFQISCAESKASPNVSPNSKERDLSPGKLISPGKLSIEVKFQDENEELKPGSITSIPSDSKNTPTCFSTSLKEDSHSTGKLQSIEVKIQDENDELELKSKTSIPFNDENTIPHKDINNVSSCSRKKLQETSGKLPLNKETGVKQFPDEAIDKKEELSKFRDLKNSSTLKNQTFDFKDKDNQNEKFLNDSVQEMEALFDQSELPMQEETQENDSDDILNRNSEEKPAKKEQVKQENKPFSEKFPPKFANPQITGLISDNNTSINMSGDMFQPSFDLGFDLEFDMDRNSPDAEEPILPKFTDSEENTNNFHPHTESAKLKTGTTQLKAKNQTKPLIKAQQHQPSFDLGFDLQFDMDSNSPESEEQVLPKFTTDSEENTNNFYPNAESNKLQTGTTELIVKNKTRSPLSIQQHCPEPTLSKFTTKNEENTHNIPTDLDPADTINFGKSENPAKLLLKTKTKVPKHCPSPTNSSVNLSQTKRKINQVLFADLSGMQTEHSVPVAKVKPQRFSPIESDEDFSTSFIPNTPAVERVKPHSLKRSRGESYLDRGDANDSDSFNDSDNFVNTRKKLKMSKCLNDTSADDETPIKTHRFRNKPNFLSSEGEEFTINSSDVESPVLTGKKKQKNRNFLDETHTPLSQTIARVGNTRKHSTPKVELFESEHSDASSQFSPELVHKRKTYKQMNKDQLRKSRVAMRQHHFVEDEAEVSIDGAVVSSDENEEDIIDEEMLKFVNDNSQLTQHVDDDESLVNEQAMYLKSVRSPFGGKQSDVVNTKGRFKLAFGRGQDIDVFSQATEADSYLEDSFCVESEEPDHHQDLGEITILQEQKEQDVIGGRRITRGDAKLHKALKQRAGAQLVKKKVKSDTRKRRIVCEESDSDETDIEEPFQNEIRPQKDAFHPDNQPTSSTCKNRGFPITSVTPIPDRLCEICGAPLTTKGWLCKTCLAAVKESERISVDSPLLSAKSTTPKERPPNTSNNPARISPAIAACSREERLLRSKQKQQELRQKLMNKRKSFDAQSPSADPTPLKTISNNSRITTISPIKMDSLDVSLMASPSYRNPGQLVILIDSREVSSGASRLVQLLRTQHNVNATVASLQVCDYILGYRLAAVRKTASDLSTVASRQKIASQLTSAQTYFAKVVLIVEKDRVRSGKASFSSTSQLHHYTSNLITICQSDFRLLFSDNQEQSAEILNNLASSERRHGNNIDSKILAYCTDPKLKNLFNVYNSLPGISYLGALQLCHKFKSLQAICKSSIDDLIKHGRLDGNSAETLKNFLRKKFDIQMLPS